MSDVRWRVLRDGPADGAWNMAVDEAIAQAVGDGRVPPTLRFYHWSRPTVSLGYAQRANGAVDWGACRRLQIDIVRRPTGGRALLHDREVTYSAAVPVDGPWGDLSVVESFTRMGQALVSGLERLGIRATIGDGTVDRSAPSRPEACFQLRRAPSILVAGRKLIGSAQRRWAKSLLQHGSVLLGFDPPLQRAVFPAWPGDPSEGVAWLAALLGGMPPPGAVEAALADGWAAAAGEVSAPGALTPEEEQAARDLIRSRYGNRDWTFRR
jgi:lipoyl(octanoyl) transferase